MSDGKAARAKARRECVTRAEAEALAATEHVMGGHWSRDLVKLKLMDRICSVCLDQSIIKALRDCGRCKNFGSTHLHALLQPITR